MASLMNGARAACLALLTAACASPSGGGVVRASDGTVDAGVVRFQPLDPQPMSSGACAMFLWAQVAQQPVLVLAAFAAPAEARVKLRDREVVLRRTGAEGEARHGHYEMQTFSDGRLTLVVDVEFGSAPMQGGARIERGVIRVTDNQGWQAIVPVGGLVGCEA
jgi:hypothetical protein